MSRSTPRPTSILRSSVIAGLVLALLVLAAGGYVASTQQKTFTAESVLVVLPRADLDEATTAAFYETLSRGQIVGTFAEVANNPTLQQEATANLSVPADEREHLTTVVSVVPDTSVILVRVTADDAATAEAVADGVAAVATRSLTALSNAFRTQVVHGATGSAVASGMSPLLVIGLALIAALVLGLSLQQATYHLLRSRSSAVPDATTTQPTVADPPLTGTSVDGSELARRSLAKLPSTAGLG